MSDTQTDGAPLPVPDYEASVRFLELHGPEEVWLLLAIHALSGRITGRSFPPDPRRREIVLAWLAKHGTPQQTPHGPLGHNIHYHPNPAHAHAKLRGGKASKTDIAEVRYLMVDCDPRVGEELSAEQQRLRSVFAKETVRPTFLVDSGNGLQALYKLQDPIPLPRGTEEEADAAALYNLGLAVRLDGDRACKDISHVMRLPGTVNWPNATKRKKGRVPALAVLLEHNEVAHELTAFPPAPSATSPTPRESSAKTFSKEVGAASSVAIDQLQIPGMCRAIILAGDDVDRPDRFNGDRSKAVWYAVHELVRCGVDDDTIHAIITGPQFAISAHVLDQAKPAAYAWQQIKKAHDAEKASPPVLFPGTPLRSARTFLRREMRHLVRFRDEWFSYDGCAFYRQLTDTTVRASVQRFLDGALTLDGDSKLVAFPVAPNTVGAVETVLKADVDIPGESYLDVTRWLRNPGPPPSEIVSCRNGLLHLPARLLLPATPDFFTLNALDVRFDPTAPVPLAWLRFLDQLWPGDPQCISLLQEWFGYVIMRGTDQHKILLLVGPPRSGKTTIARVLTELVGNANVANPTLHSLAVRFGTSQLLGKQLAIISEARMDARSADASHTASLLLSISGEDEVAVERKFKDIIKVRLPTRVTIISNELPAVAENSGALSNRLLMLGIGVSFLGKEDRGLLGRLLGELPGILNWSFEGYERLMKRGHFVQPDSGRELREQFEDVSSPMAAFARESCDFRADAWVTKRRLFAAYQHHAQRSGLRWAKTYQQFCADFLAAFRGKVRDTRPAARGRGGARERGFAGVSLRDRDPTDGGTESQTDLPF
ncbi:MAG: hypothetical protein KDC98_12915 [Planctomycetes bacterium]|nr:hypothetical protein [Planctomycetota bacterium]